jgi:hypothetical protein
LRLAILCGIAVLPVSIFSLLVASRSLLKGEEAARAELAAADAGAIEEASIGLPIEQLT